MEWKSMGESGSLQIKTSFCYVLNLCERIQNPIIYRAILFLVPCFWAIHAWTTQLGNFGIFIFFIYSWNVNESKFFLGKGTRVSPIIEHRSQCVMWHTIHELHDIIRKQQLINSILDLSMLLFYQCYFV